MRIDGVAWDNDNVSAKVAEKGFSTTGSVCVCGAPAVQFCHEKKICNFGKKKAFSTWKMVETGEKS